MFKHETNLYKWRQINIKRFLSNCINPEMLSDLFGLPSLKAKIFIEKNRLQNKDGEQVKTSINFCRKLGYTDNDILKTPGLLRITPLELEQHYLTLEEGGFHSIGPKILVRARNYMKRVIKSLKTSKVISETTNVPEEFLRHIQDPEIVKKIPIHDFSDDNKWNEVHKSILQTFLSGLLSSFPTPKFNCFGVIDVGNLTFLILYLAGAAERFDLEENGLHFPILTLEDLSDGLTLDATEDEIIRLFRIHMMVKNKSFRIVQENISIAQDLGFEKHKILKYGYLLHNYPDYTKTVLRDFPNLAGANMRKAMRMYPKLVMISPTNIIKIYGILKEFNIEDEAIRNQMNVFHMSPDTVKLRLEEIERSPDFRVLLGHPKVLSLIVHHNRAKSRLSFLQQLQMRCASLIVLNTDAQDTFDDYVREGKDVNRMNDVLIYLKELFDTDIGLVRKKMKCHPYYLYVPLKDMQETYDYLIAQQFQHDSIFKVMHILLYPQEKIQNALNQIRTNREIQIKSLKQTKLLNLVLYFIEKEHHFTGNGIWRKSDNVENIISEKSLE